ncbi:hypothetical protein PILCRDRAFT_687889 [Piloderma croceum F 1598]|uniref:Uncharacterized protein n=1 Tax=Piloderma croceum (strain F 1598) TaxID=765440 RepID=A0A0C3BCT0_PILCF|nr:hypothetical protein PILCRDRAFT_687889 [Piloderma croceum F 1598]
MAITAEALYSLAEVSNARLVHGKWFCKVEMPLDSDRKANKCELNRFDSGQRCYRVLPTNSQKRSRIRTTNEESCAIVFPYASIPLLSLSQVRHLGGPRWEDPQASQFRWPLIRANARLLRIQPPFLHLYLIVILHVCPISQRSLGFNFARLLSII